MKVSTTDFDQFDQKTGRRGSMALHVTKNESSIQQIGLYRGPLGMVEVWTFQVLPRPNQWTTLETIHDGRTYRRRWRRAWGRKTLTRLCREFLEDLHRQSSPDRIPL